MSSRLFLTLDYAGLGNQVAMLDGGLEAWKEEERPVTQNGTVFQEGTIDITEQARTTIHPARFQNCDRAGVLLILPVPWLQFLKFLKTHDRLSRSKEYWANLRA